MGGSIETEPLIEASADDTVMRLLGERVSLIEQLLALRRIHPGVQVSFVVKLNDRHPVVLHARDRGADLEALRTRKLGLRGGDMLRPLPVGLFLTGTDLHRDDR